MTEGFIFLIFSLWRIADFAIAYIAKLFDRYNEHFLYKFQLYHSNSLIPKFLVAFGNYDGEHYLHIAHDGYKQYEQSFFPLFSLLVRLLSYIFAGQYFLPGFFLANMSFLLGLFFFKKYLQNIGKNADTIVWIFLFLVTFPTSFFFGAVYTEGLFFLLVCASLFFAQRKKYALLVVTSVLASLTRVVGVFLIIPIFAILVIQEQKLKLENKSWEIKGILYFFRSHKKLIAISFSPLVGLFTYMTYLLIAVHNPFAFYNSLNAFNTGRTTKHIILLPQVYYRYIHIFFTVSHSVTYFIAVIEFFIFNLFFLVLLYDLWLLWRQKDSTSRISLIGLNLFSLVSLLLPTFTGTLTSLPRYSLLSLSFFIRIAQIRSRLLRIVIVLLFIVFHIILLTLFIQGYFVS